MPPAIIAAGIGAAGAIGGTALANKGAKTAAKATQQASDQAAQVTREVYGQNQAALAPWQGQGLQANSLINAALGMGGGQVQPQMQTQYTGPNPAAAPVGMQNAMLGVDYMNDPNNGYQTPGINPNAQPMGQNPQNTASSAFDIFRNSTGYNFRLGQGMDAVNSGYAGRGTLQSGAALKSINDYGQGMASQEFGNWLGSLGNQQALGFSAASAQAGVGQNYANSLANIYQNNGSNQANAALLKAQNTGQMFNSLGTLAGGFLGGYGK